MTMRLLSNDKENSKMTMIMRHSITSYNINTLLKNKVARKTSSIRKYITESRNEKRKEMNTFHRTFLINKIKTHRNNSVFLTDPNITQGKTRNLSNDQPNQINKNNTRELSLSLSSFSPSSNPNLLPCYDNDKYKVFFSDMTNLKNDYRRKVETTQAFIDKSKLIVKSKYIKTLQCEQYKKVKEKNHIMKSHYDVLKYSIKNDYNLLTEFLYEQRQYVKYLHHKLDVSKDESYRINDVRICLEKEVRELQKLVHMKKLKGLKARDYQEFLLKVKYKTKHLNNIPNEVLLEYGIDKRRDSLRRRTVRNLASKDNVTQCLKPKPIFASPEDFIDRMNELDHNLYKLFKVNHKQGEKIKVLSISKRKTYSMDMANYLQEENEQEYIKILQQEKKDVIKEHQSNIILLEKLTNDYHKTPINQRVFSKMKEILLDLPIDLEEDFDEINVYDLLRSSNTNTCGKQVIFNGKKCTLLIYFIKLIEKILLFYMIKMKKIKENSYMKKGYDKCEKIVYKSKRILINKKNRDDEIENRRLLCENIINKNKKVNWKAKRIVNQLMNPKHNKPSDVAIKDSQANVNYLIEQI